MSQRTCRKILMTAAMVLASSASSASVLFDYNFANLGVTGGQAYNTVSMTAGGINVDISAVTIANDGSGNISSTTAITGAGLGVYVSSSTSGNLGVLSSASGDGTNLDGGSGGIEPDEGLLFSFSEAVSIAYINFDSFGSSDDFNLTVDGTTYVVDYASGDLSPFVNDVPGQSDEFTFNNVIGTNFLFWVDSDSDSIRIDRMVIPEPATWVLMLAGIAGIARYRRR